MQTPTPRQQSARPSGAAGRLSVFAAVAALGALLAGPTATAVAVLPSDTQDDPSLQQQVGGDEASVAGREVVTDGHVDVGPRFVDGTWTLQARDDRAVPPVWRSPDETVFHVGDASVLEAPESPDYAFLGVEAGAPLYVVPQVQNQEVVWLGWNTQDPEVTQRIDRGATLRLDGVEGPGAFHLFLQEGVTGPPNVLWSSAADYPQDLWMDVNSHVHANWVFTEPGVYELDVTMIADLTDGTHVEDPGVLRFAVGSSTDPQTAFPAADPEPTESASEESSAASSEPAEPAPSPERDEAAGAVEGASTSNVALWVGLAAVVLVAAVVLTVLRGRRARARAEEEIDAASRPTGSSDEPGGRS
ncbi:TIGR03769 domain-containing protein [Cellulosimicrobium cellulans]|uniref:choice-of-anchor M domain-containing protein n=1 Tax=Cellulosimicrobium cellulans TaxID=1710 RepID=UPI001ED9F331|nr:choice-of-anchor M domain-containing protein [Cellulosimicrobium cellulans]UKJ63326.1 TIGR03769 domain-containing protein [Cellulosimicrobium cellulans]